MMFSNSAGSWKPPLRVDLELHVVAGELGSDRTGRGLHVLARNRLRNIGIGDSDARILFGFSQMRMLYVMSVNTIAWPTPSMREIGSRMWIAT